MLKIQNRITLKTIAAECGYSVNTVSRALRNDPKLSKEALVKIQKTADDLGYIRNMPASSLRSGKSHVIAAIVEDIQNPHYTSLLSRLDELLMAMGYTLMILSSRDNEKTEQTMIQIAISHSVDGIFLFPHSSVPHSVNLILKNHIPLVLVDREISGIPVDTVRVDDFNGGYLVGKHFVSLGHRRFLYIAGPLTNGSQPLRQEGFLTALEEAGIQQEHIRIIPSREMLYAIEKDTIMELLAPINYTAVFSFNDEMAYYAVNKLLLHGFSIPGNLSFAGFDRIRQDTPYLFPLSGISARKGYSLAETAVRLLFSRIEDPDRPFTTEVLPVEFYEDGTTGICASQ